MANPEHVEAVKSGAGYLMEYREALGDKELDLSGARFDGVSLSKLRLAGANLRGAHLENLQCKETDFTGADLQGANMTGTHLKGACMESANLKAAKLTSANMEQADLSNTDLSKTDLSNAYMVNCTLCGATMKETILTGANLTGANLSGACMTDAQCNQSTFNGATLENTEISKCNFIGSGMNGARLHKCKILKTHFKSARLENIDIENCIVSVCDFSEAMINNSTIGSGGISANFEKSHLEDTKFRFVDLIGSRFDGAHLARTSFFNCDLTDTSFHEAIIDRTEFSGVRNAHLAKNLDTVLVAQRSRHFETVKIPWHAQSFLSWEGLRTAGRLPLFSASYIVVIGIPIFLYLTAFYNELLSPILTWAELSRTSTDMDFRELAVQIDENVQIRKPPSQMFWAWLSSICLATGATIYALACPSRIREFSRDQWVDEHKNDILHYWPQSWSKPVRRWACAILYATGGILAVLVIGTKSIRALDLITREVDWFWPPL